MAFNPASGKEGSVLIGTVPYAFKNWKINSGQELPKVNNFTGGGFQQVVGGLEGGELTFEGPWDVGNMPIVVGNSYTFICAVNGSVSVSVPAIVGKIEFGTDVEDAARVKVSAQTNGSFSVEFA